MPCSFYYTAIFLLCKCQLRGSRRWVFYKSVGKKKKSSYPKSVGQGVLAGSSCLRTVSLGFVPMADIGNKLLCTLLVSTFLNWPVFNGFFVMFCFRLDNFLFLLSYLHAFQFHIIVLLSVPGDKNDVLYVIFFCCLFVCLLVFHLFQFNFSLPISDSFVRAS